MQGIAHCSRVNFREEIWSDLQKGQAGKQGWARSQRAARVALSKRLPRFDAAASPG